MEHPLVHLNGTSRYDLIAQHIAVLDALRDAEKAMIAASPNARDYYPKAAGAFERARQEHSERCQMLAAIFEQYMVLCLQLTEEDR